MSRTINTDDVLDALYDIADDLAIDDDWDEPTAHTMNLRSAAQYLADTIAERIGKADVNALDEAFQYMATDEGWHFEAHDITLWSRENDFGPDTLVVWFGNDRDHDMKYIGEAEMLGKVDSRRRPSSGSEAQ